MFPQRIYKMTGTKILIIISHYGVSKQNHNENEMPSHTHSWLMANKTDRRQMTTPTVGEDVE